MSIEERLQRVEKQNRLYRHLFILAGLVAIAFIVWGQAKPIPEVIRARKFIVENSSGETIVDIGGGGMFYGGSSITVYGWQSGTNRLSPTTNISGGGISFHDQILPKYINLAIGSEGIIIKNASYKLVLGRTGTVRSGKGLQNFGIQISLIEKGTGYLTQVFEAGTGYYDEGREGGFLEVMNKKGQVFAAMTAKPKGGSLAVNNDDAGIVALLDAFTEGGQITVSNNNGKVVGGIGVDDFGHGMLQVCHRSENKCKNFQYAPK